MPYRPFLAYNIAGGLVWGTGTVLAGYFLGTAVERTLRSAGFAVLAAAAVLALALLTLARRRASRQRRRPFSGEPAHGTSSTMLTSSKSRGASIPSRW